MNAKASQDLAMSRGKTTIKRTVSLATQIKKDFEKAITLLSFSRTELRDKDDMLDFAILIALYC